MDQELYDQAYQSGREQGRHGLRIELTDALADLAVEHGESEIVKEIMRLLAVTDPVELVTS